jgi:hypothetical protein
MAPMAIEDLADVVDTFSDNYTVTRSGLISYDQNGDPVTGSTGTLTIRACVQPIMGRDLMRMPEGWRTQELLAIFTTTELFTKASANEPDTISVNGVNYQIQQVERWADLGNYWRAVAMKVGTT